MDVNEAFSSRDDLHFLDVREPHEWDAGHVPGAQHIPLGQVMDRMAEIPEDLAIVAICRSGARSARVTAVLRRSGRDVENLEGGMLAWAKADLPFEATDGSEARVV